MVTATTTTIPALPTFAQQPTVDIAKTLEELLQQPLQVPQQQVAGFSPTQLSAMNLAQQGIGSFQPFLQAAQAAQTAGLGTLGAGVQTVGGAQFEPTQQRIQQFMDPYQQSVTQEALKEIDRQSAMAGNQLAGGIGSGTSGAIAGGLGGFQSPGIGKVGQFGTNLPGIFGIGTSGKVAPVGLEELFSKPGASKFFFGKGDDRGLFGKFDFTKDVPKTGLVCGSGATVC